MGEEECHGTQHVDVQPSVMRRSFVSFRLHHAACKTEVSGRARVLLTPSRQDRGLLRGAKPGLGWQHATRFQNEG